MNRKWLYSHEKGGHIFDITTEEYTDAVDSGYWFDRPDKVKPKEEDTVTEKEKKYTKHALGRMSAGDRVAVGVEYDVDLSKNTRKEQIEEILKLQG